MDYEYLALEVNSHLYFFLCLTFGGREIKHSLVTFNEDFCVTAIT